MGMASELARGAARRCAVRPTRLAAPLAELVARLQRRPPQVVVTCARGSSAHAATFAKHLIELYLGIPVAAAAPNIASVYHRRLRLEGQLFLAISQSGRSDDLIANAAMAQRGRRADGGAGQRYGQPARCGMRHRAADLRRAGAQRRRDQDALSPALPRCCAWSRLGRGPRPSPPPSTACRSGSRAPAISIGARRSTRSPRRRASSRSAAARPWRSPARRR